MSRKIAAVLLLLTPSLASAQDTSTVVVGPMGSSTDSVLRLLEPSGFSGVVLVAKNGVPVLRKGYGLANRAERIPLTAGSLIQIGSNVKDFTVVAILQLVEKRKLSLSDSLSKFFSNVPADKRAITVDQLVNHRAGFDHALSGDFVKLSREEGISKAMTSVLRFAPGSEQSYSNTGYSLLASVIEKVSGQRYQDYIRENIFRPAGMTETGYVRGDAAASRHAHGYAGDDDIGPISRQLAALGDDYWNLLGNGGMVSTVGDMYRFYGSLFRSERLLSRAIRDTRYQPGPTMLAGSDRVSFFLYNSDPAAAMDMIIATNSNGFRGPRARDALAPVLGLSRPQGRAERDMSISRPAAGPATVASGPPTRPAPGPPTGHGMTRPDSPNASFPDSPAGRIAGQYSRAMSTGTPDAVRAFLRSSLAPNPGDSRTIDARAEIHVGLQGSLGFMTLLKVEAASENDVSFVVRAVQAGERTFTIRVEPAPPHRIMSIQVRQ